MLNDKIYVINYDDVGGGNSEFRVVDGGRKQGSVCVFSCAPASGRSRASC